MYALVVNNEIVKVFANPEPFTLNDNQYPAQVFTLWSNEEKNAIGIYEIETDSSKFKDESYYINTNEIFEFKKHFQFDKQLYSKDEIFTIFELDDNIMNNIL